MVRIGVLSIQGSVSEHMTRLSELEGVIPVRVRDEEALSEVDGLIIPGGESTAIGRLLNEFNLMGPLRERIERGMPVWGTCAGLILLAGEVENEKPWIGAMDIVARRNAFGRQTESFRMKRTVPSVSDKPIELVFIRAPIIVRAGEGVEVLVKTGDKIAAARQGRMLATSFHPELTSGNDFHNYFASIVRECMKS
ncbi:pyridoxal 5'-phosphate synthase glutaminase subunit PdxT [Youngiibacter fragilis]|uniref:Pyridoxal 5'-phosphate synthase subunit PdxT n=1 Tax=Youngiibacter fragilis 232.1 TaxID=994573 RepID=V7I881_9CLOT|nr:pyridoxal 5'-phosphate synthase glutaminase subunit PdxT [Youngiibacter fragilis]ETA82400.1 glutamine amidotransferase [Youngiibacter fragilis 232.1]